MKLLNLLRLLVRLNTPVIIVTVYVSIDCVSGSVANSVRIFFFLPTSTDTDKPNFVSFLVFVCARELFHLPLKFNLSKLSRNEKPF